VPPQGAAYRCIDFDNLPRKAFSHRCAGLVRWRDISDKPFNDPAFLLAEAKQLATVAVAR
jgi:hypothetical protein